MNTITKQFLQDLNQQFYREIAPLWNNSPEYYWEGWDRLLPSIKKLPETISILDIGCGNGRFANFLLEKTGKNIEYHGVDTDPYWIKEHVITHNPRIQRFLSLENALTYKPQIKFDIVVAFGLLHHIPGYNDRKALISMIKESTKDNGIWVYTWWNFMEVPRLKKRVLPKEDIKKVIGAHQAELEPGDYILDWVKEQEVYRYSHYPTLEEFNPDTTHYFKHDGRHSNRNIYISNSIH